MFKEEHDVVLRFGDVLDSYTLVYSNLKSLSTSKNKYSIDIEIPKNCVLLTPCCSIGEHDSFLLTPLIRLNDSFVMNPYFTEDFTRINREMKKEYAIPPKIWNKMDEEEKVHVKSVKSFAFFDNFCYGPLPENLFNPYTLGNDHLGIVENVKFLMIDFRNVFKVKCLNLKKPNKDILDTKILQLTEEVRKELRLKMSHFYYRPTEEDSKILATR